MSGQAARHDQPVLDRIFDAVTSVAGSGAALHEPEFAGNEWEYVKACLDSGWVSTAGSFVDRFEDMIREVTGAPHAIATVNGTSALHAAFMLAGVGRDDEVIMPAVTFVATANAAAYLGAVPHFADIDERSLGIDVARLAAHLEEHAERRDDGSYNLSTGRKIAAVTCVHTYGHPVDLDPLAALCERYGVALIEDAAESLGTLYKGRHTGNHGLLSTLSFNGNKIITTGGGGAILTADDELATRARHLTTTAKLPHRWEFDFDRTGFNYRLPNINAALGCAQLEQLTDFVSRKRALAEAYHRAFADVAGVTAFAETDFAHSNYWLNVILLDSAEAGLRDPLLVRLNDAGVMSRPCWVPMHRLEMYRNNPAMALDVTEDHYRRLICIPSSAGLARP